MCHSWVHTRVARIWGSCEKSPQQTENCKNLGKCYFYIWRLVFQHLRLSWYNIMWCLYIPTQKMHTNHPTAIYICLGQSHKASEIRLQHYIPRKILQLKYFDCWYPAIVFIRVSSKMSHVRAFGGWKMVPHFLGHSQRSSRIEAPGTLRALTSGVASICVCVCFCVGRGVWFNMNSGELTASSG